MDRWDWNGPEEGDEVDLSVVIMFDGEEVMQLDGDEDTVDTRRKIAGEMCQRLNAGGWIGLV